MIGSMIFTRNCYIDKEEGKIEKRKQKDNVTYIYESRMKIFFARRCEDDEMKE